MNKIRDLYLVWIIFLIVLIFFGGVALILSLFLTMEIFEFSLKVIWALMVSNYVFFVVSSTGLCMVSSLGHVFGSKTYEQIGKLGVFLAIITIIFGMASIGFHLGRPDRLYYNLLTPNLESAIWWMGTLYSFYVVFIIIEFWFLIREDLKILAKDSHGIKGKIYHLLTLESFLKRFNIMLTPEKEHSFAKIVGALALISGIAAHNTLGAVFGHTESRPHWYGGFYPAYFLISAFFCGLSWIMGTLILTYRILARKINKNLEKLLFDMGRLLLFFLGFAFLLTTYKYTTAFKDPIKTKTLELLFFGPLNFSFWFFEILVGTLLPIGLLIYGLQKKKLNPLMWASFSVLIGVFVMRYDFVVVAQVYPLFNPLGKPPLEIITTFFPTFFEILLIAGLISAFLLSYTLGIRYLPIFEDKHAE